MTAMLDAAAIETLTRSVMLGTSRQAAPVQKAFGGLIAPDDPKAALKALALLGQRSRFRRPACVAPTSVEPLFTDERAIVPEAARPLLLSLLSDNGGDLTDAVPVAVADAMERQRLRLHPFDLAQLEEFVKAHADQLGASAVAWTQRRVTATSATLTPSSRPSTKPTGCTDVRHDGQRSSAACGQRMRHGGARW
jgi:hypothetical protein